MQIFAVNEREGKFKETVEIFRGEVGEIIEKDKGAAEIMNKTR